MEDCFKLLHFHLGSQIPNIRIIKGALTEAARVYVELHKAGAGLKYMDVGGGLGVDYDGSQTNFESSLNYTLEEYASDVVYHLQTVCDEASVPHPTIVSESGRAVVAHHSLLVFNVLGVSGFGEGVQGLPKTPTPELEQPLVDLIESYESLTSRNATESYHDAQQALDTAMNLFSAGYLPLEQRSLAENLYWAICLKLQKLVKTMDEVPEDLQNLDESLSDTYFCNFSLFQSIPDSWAIKQLFPIMPIHRLNERPTRHAVLGDITCDSDGKVDQFIDRRDVKRTLPLHLFNGSPVLPGRVSRRRVPGNPRRPAQPARRHPRGARQPRRRRLGRARRRHQGRHGSRGAGLRRIRRRSPRGKAAPRRRSGGAKRPPGLRGVRAGCCASTKRASTATPTSKNARDRLAANTMPVQPIVVFTDGASKGNPGPGGWGAIVATPEGHVTELGGGAAITTNNKMELTGAIQALTPLLETQRPRGHLHRLDLRDQGHPRVGSELAPPRLEDGNRQRGDESRAVGRAPRASRRAAGRAPSSGTTCAGTSALPGNERCDEIADAFATQRPVELYDGPLSGYPIPLGDLPDDTSVPARKPSSTGAKKGVPYSYLSVVDGKPMRHATWAECEQRVKGRSGALFKKATSEADQADILRSWRFKPEDVS